VLWEAIQLYDAQKVLTERIPKSVSPDTCIDSRGCNGLDMYKNPFSTICPKKLLKLSLLAVDWWGDAGFKWEECVKQCVARFVWCDNWQLTA
jgi:transposase